MDASPSVHPNDRLRQERIRHNWRQQEVANHLGTTVVSVKRWERGSHQPSLYFREKLCTLFEKSAEELGLMPERPRPVDKGGTEAVSFSPASPRVWGVPFSRNPFFTGRDPVLDHVHTALTHLPTRAALTQSYAIHGLGGIGKTQLAIEYAYQHRSDYDAVLWVEAETQTTLVSSFVTLAALLTLPEQTEEDQSKIVAAVLRWLNGHLGWLLIFDNVEDLSLLKSFLPASDQGSILLTTRLQSLGTLAQRIELPPMAMQEGCDFLLARTNRLRQGEQHASIDPQEVAVAQQIVSEMGGLPLALEQAGAYIDANQCSLVDYLHLFRTAQHRLLDEHESSSDHPLSVSQTFAVAFERVEQFNPLATELLTACAFLAPDAIPEMFFLEGAAHLGPMFETLAADPFLLNNAIKALLTYSLLQRNASTKTVTIHRLVQVVLKGHLSEAALRLWTRRIVHTMTQLFPSDQETQVTYWQDCEQLLPHAQGCLLLGDQWDEEMMLRLPLMSHIASYLFKRIRWIEAEQLFTRAVQLGGQALGGEHPLVAEALHGLANLYKEQDKYAEAEPLFVRALCIRERALGAGHPLVAQTLGRLGNLYRKQGKYEQAEPLLQRALLIQEQAFGPDHPLVAYPLNGLGILYKQQGKYEQAEPLLQRALFIREQTLGPQHREVASPLNNLGFLYKQQGKYEQAERVFQRALFIREEALGPQHLQVAISLNGLGFLYYQQGKYEQAEPLLQRALLIQEQALGPDNSDVAIPLNNLGFLYYQQGKYEQAEPLLQRALHIWEQALGPQHPHVAEPLNGLANLYREQALYTQAKLLYQRALRILEQALGPQHPEVADCLYDLARFHQLQQHLTEALSLYQQALAIYEHALGPDHLKTRRTQTDYTHLLEEVKKEDREGIRCVE